MQTGDVSGAGQAARCPPEPSRETKVESLRTTQINGDCPDIIQLKTGDIVVDIRGSDLNRVDRDGIRCEGRVRQRLGHFADLKPEPGANRLIDRVDAFDDLDDRLLIFRQAETVNPVFRLEIVCGIKGAVQIDRMVADAVKADAFAGGRRIGHHHPNIVVVMEGLNLPFTGVGVVFVSSVHPAVNIDRAQIGILRQVRDPRAACEFVSMILSREGQLALLKPNIGRVPYDPTIRAEFEDQLPEGIIQTLRLPWLNYDAGMSADRYWSVNTLFDLMITEQLTERRDLWRRAHALDGRVAPERLAHLRRALTAIPISWDEAQEASRRIAGGVRGTVLVSLGDA